MAKIAEAVRQQLVAAIKGDKDTEKAVLRVLLGEIQTAEARQGSLSDEQAANIVRKIIKNNNETLEVLRKNPSEQNNESASRLETENRILEQFLPQTLSPEEISQLLSQSEIRPQIIAAKNDGAAMGVAMKFLKDKGAVEGNVVKEVVAQLRQES